MKSLLSLPLEALEPEVRAAAEDLDAFIRADGLPELELIDAPRHRPLQAREWAQAGCSWAVRCSLYSRRQRAVVLQRLMKGRRHPEWEIVVMDAVGGPVILCLHRNFAWRNLPRPPP